MTSQHTKRQIEYFGNAVTRLNDALRMNETEIVRDGIIQRFKVAYELAWRSLRHFLNEQGDPAPETSATVLVRGYSMKLIDDAALWHRIGEMRGLIQDAHQDDIANLITTFVRSHAMTAFEGVLAELRKQP